MRTGRALLCGEVMHVGAAGGDLQRFLEDRRFRIQKLAEGDEPFTPYVLRSVVFSLIRLVQKSHAFEVDLRL